jgi:hypothetical protein
MLCREPCVDESAEDEKPFVLSLSKHERRLFTRLSYLQGTATEASGRNSLLNVFSGAHCPGRFVSLAKGDQFSEAHRECGSERCKSLRLVYMVGSALTTAVPDVPTIAEAGVPGYGVDGGMACSDPLPHCLL